MAVTVDLTPEHLTLGQLIERLRREPDQSRRVKVGFGNPHSYRTPYEDVAFEIVRDVTVGDMLAAAVSALGSTFQGRKGGDFTMGEYTRAWLVTEEGDCGESIGAVLLGLMLADAADQVDQPRTPSGCDGEDSPEDQGKVFVAAIKTYEQANGPGWRGTTNPEERTDG